MNKMYCIAITFWEYIRLGFKEVFSSPESYETVVAKKWVVIVFENILNGIKGSLIGLVIVYFMRLFFSDKTITEIMIWIIYFSVVFLVVLVILSIAFFIFLIISWKKSVSDCWDKFQ